MRSAGMPIEDLPGPPIFADSGDAARAARRNGCGWSAAAASARRSGRRRPRHETMRLLFEAVAAEPRRRAAPPEPGTIQWDFPDAEPWHVVVANGSTRARPGLRTRRHVTLRTRFEDWVDVTSGRVAPAAASRCAGALRPKGDVRWLWRARRMFPA